MDYADKHHYCFNQHFKIMKTAFIMAALLSILSGCSDTTDSKTDRAIRTPTSTVSGAAVALQEIKDALEKKKYSEVIALHTAMKKSFPIAPETSSAEQFVNEATGLLEAEKKALLIKINEQRKDFIHEVDEMRDVEFYTHKLFPKYDNERSVLQTYIAAGKGGKPVLRLKNVYVGRDWLFIKSYILKVGDAKLSFDSEDSKIKRDNASGSVWEIYDKPIQMEDPLFIMLMALGVSDVSKAKAIIRYEGRDYYRDREIGEKEIKAIRQTIQLYESMFSLSKLNTRESK